MSKNKIEGVIKIFSYLTQKEVEFSRHALIRLVERFGDMYWHGRQIKDLPLSIIKELIRCEMKRPLGVILEEKKKVKIITQLFVIVMGITQGVYIIKTVYRAEEDRNLQLYFKVEEVVDDEVKIRLRMVIKKKQLTQVEVD